MIQHKFTTILVVSWMVFFSVRGEDCFLLDEFNHPAFNGSDGTVLWQPPWFSRDVVSTDPQNGQVVVGDGVLELSNPTQEVDEDRLPFVERNLNVTQINLLMNMTFALNFRGGIGSSSVINVEFTTNKVDYTILSAINGEDARQRTIFTIDLSDSLYHHPNSHVRFRIASGFPGTSAKVDIEFVKVEVECLLPATSSKSTTSTTRSDIPSSSSSSLSFSSTTTTTSSSTTTTNACSLHICHRNATCVVTAAGPACRCPQPFFGSRCQCEIGVDREDVCNDFDVCSSSPCQYGGICTLKDVVPKQHTFHGTSFVCQCPLGLAGTFCEEDIDECLQNNPCGQRGVCSNTFGSFVCSCQRGFTGKLCHDDINECDLGTQSTFIGRSTLEQTKLVACENGGICTNRRGTFTCDCPSFTSGSRCQNLIACTDLPDPLILETHESVDMFSSLQCAKLLGGLIIRNLPEDVSSGTLQAALSSILIIEKYLVVENVHSFQFSMVSSISFLSMMEHHSNMYQGRYGLVIRNNPSLVSTPEMSLFKLHTITQYGQILIESNPKLCIDNTSVVFSNEVANVAEPPAFWWAVESRLHVRQPLSSTCSKCLLHNVSSLAMKDVYQPSSSHLCVSQCASCPRVCLEPPTISSRNDVDRLLQLNCSVLSGDLVISHLPSTLLGKLADAIQSIVHITGDIVIDNIQGLLTLNLLSNIRTAKSLIVINNPNLIVINLPELVTIRNSTFINNPSLQGEQSELGGEKRKYETASGQHDFIFSFSLSEFERIARLDQNNFAQSLRDAYTHVVSSHPILINTRRLLNTTRLDVSYEKSLQQVTVSIYTSGSASEVEQLSLEMEIGDVKLALGKVFQAQITSSRLRRELRNISPFSITLLTPTVTSTFVALQWETAMWQNKHVPTTDIIFFRPDFPSLIHSFLTLMEENSPQNCHRCNLHTQIRDTPSSLSSPSFTEKSEISDALLSLYTWLEESVTSSALPLNADTLELFLGEFFPWQAIATNDRKLLIHLCQTSALLQPPAFSIPSSACLYPSFQYEFYVSAFVNPSHQEDVPTVFLQSNKVSAIIPLPKQHAISLTLTQKLLSTNENSITNDPNSMAVVTIRWETDLAHSSVFLQVFTATGLPFQASLDNLEDAVFDSQLASQVEPNVQEQPSIASWHLPNTTTYFDLTGCFSVFSILSSEGNNLSKVHCINPFEVYAVSVQLVGTLFEVKPATSQISTATFIPMSPLRNVSVATIETHRVFITGIIPARPNGVLNQLFVSLQIQPIQLDPLSDPWTNSFSRTLPLPNMPKTQFGDDSAHFTVELSQLQPYRRYRATIFPGTSAGFSMEQHAVNISFQTMEDIPGVPETVMALILDEDSIDKPDVAFDLSILFQNKTSDKENDSRRSTQFVIENLQKDQTGKVEQDNQQIKNFQRQQHRILQSRHRSEIETTFVLVRVSWSPPIKEVGEILAYELILFGEYLGSSYKYTVYTGLNTVVHGVMTLNSSLHVRASTSAGWGQFSPRARPANPASTGRDLLTRTHWKIIIITTVVVSILVIILGIIVVKRKKNALNMKYGFFQPKPDEFELLPEQLQTVRMIDAGTFGEVYIARCANIMGTTTTQDVAVKICQGSHVTDRAKRAFLHEMDMMKRV